MKAIAVSVFFLLLRVVAAFFLLMSPSWISRVYGLVAMFDFWCGLGNLLLARKYDKSLLAWVVPIWYLLSLALIPERVLVTAAVQTYLEWALYGWAAVKILCTLWLGRCWSPGFTCNGGRLVVSGPYRWVRHPLLSLSVISRLIFLVAMPSEWNLHCLLVSFMGCSVVAWLEDSYLSEQYGEAWEEYCQRVPGSFLPRRSRLVQDLDEQNSGEADINENDPGEAPGEAEEKQEETSFLQGTALALPLNLGSQHVVPLYQPFTDWQAAASLSVTPADLAEYERNRIVESSLPDLPR